MVSHIAITPQRYDDGISEASECARPDLLQHRVERRQRPRPPVPTTGLYRPSVWTSATICAAVLSTLALML